MTHLRKMMLEELERRHYAQSTTHRYIRFNRRFRTALQPLSRSASARSTFVNTKPNYSRERRLAASTVTQPLAPCGSFYIQTLKKPWSIADTPYPKKTRPLPSILSPEEVAHLIDSARLAFIALS